VRQVGNDASPFLADDALGYRRVVHANQFDLSELQFLHRAQPGGGANRAENGAVGAESQRRRAAGARGDGKYRILPGGQESMASKSSASYEKKTVIVAATGS